MGMPDDMTEREAQAQRRIGYLEGLLREHGIEHRQIHGKKVTFSRCEKHGLYVRTDENQCPACWRGE